MGVAPCDGCSECKTTLAESADQHDPVQPHDWDVQWKAGSAAQPPRQERVCRRCLAREDV